MLLIVQARVVQGERGDSRIEWTHGGMPDDVRERFDAGVKNDPDRPCRNLKRIESRLGRRLDVGERVAVSGELEGKSFGWGQVEVVKEGMQLSDVLQLFDSSHKEEKLDDLLQGILQHVAHCDQWDNGKATTYTDLRNYGYKCGCAWEVRLHTGLVVWAEHHSGLLPPGFTEKMRFLSIRGQYLLSIVKGTHKVTRQIKVGGFEMGFLLKPIPRNGGRLIFKTEDFQQLPASFRTAKRIMLNAPLIQGVVLTNRGDDDPLSTHITINCTIEDPDAQTK